MATKTTTTTVGKNISSLPTSTIQTAVGAKSDGIYGPQTTASVKAFQSANGLVADGIVGPKTQAAILAKTNSGGLGTTSPTIGDVYNMGGGVDPNLAGAGAAVDLYNKNNADGVSNVDENGIRNKILGNFQAEIDATNATYADRLNQAKLAGAGRIGSGTAIQARRGLLGSDMGNTYTQDINNANTGVYNAIDNERQSAVTGILEKARIAADNTIKDKNAAIGAGLDAHLAYLKGLTASKEANATKAAQSIYDQNFSPDKLTADELKKTAEAYGVKPEDIKSAFITVKKTGDETKAKKTAEDLKNKLAGMKVIPTGSVLVDANGNRIAAGNPKTTGIKSSVAIKPFVSGKAVFSADQISSFSNQLEASKGVDNYVDPSAYLQAYQAWTDPNVGGLAKDFLTKYPPKKYVNPDNNTLPSYLRSSTTKAKSTSSEIDPATGLPSWLTQ